jgi:hypothetical protein
MKKVKSPSPLPKELEKTQTSVNKYVRERDKGEPCISCGSTEANQAGHYFSVATCSVLRFHPVNINLQCAGCNCWKHGNQAFYRIGLVEKWGEMAVLELERIATAPRTRLYKWSRFELEIIQNEIKNGSFGTEYKPLKNQTYVSNQRITNPLQGTEISGPDKND